MSNDDLDTDLDIDNFDESGGFDDYTKKGSLGDVWRNNPMVKIGVILAAFAFIVGGIILFGGKNEPPTESEVSSGSIVSEAPGSSEISKTMQEAIEEKNAQNAEEALRTNQSAIPIPVVPPKGQLPVTEETASGEDPLERWRQMQEERLRQQETLSQAKEAEAAAPPVDTKTPAVNALAGTMSTQMQSVLQNQAIEKPNFKQITPVTFIDDVNEKKLAKLQQQQQALAAANGTQAVEDVENILLPAGSIEYGQLMMEANTDAPGPVLAQIMSGPLKGSRVLGSFQSTDQYLVLNFNMIVIDGIDYPIQAVAVDPQTTLPGVITEIDHRYMKRVILPMAAEFVTGLTSAIAESGTTSVFIEGSSVTQSTQDKNQKQEVSSGIEAAGEKLSDIMTEEADRTKPMLRVASGTPLGILFVAPVTDSNLATRR